VCRGRVKMCHRFGCNGRGTPNKGRADDPRNLAWCRQVDTRANEGGGFEAAKVGQS
jgi:hypothetical protein